MSLQNDTPEAVVSPRKERDSDIFFFFNATPKHYVISTPKLFQSNGKSYTILMQSYTILMQSYSTAPNLVCYYSQHQTLFTYFY